MTLFIALGWACSPKKKSRLDSDSLILQDQTDCNPFNTDCFTIKSFRKSTLLEAKFWTPFRSIVLNEPSSSLQDK